MDEAKEKDRAIEIRIYKRLGDHPRVCKYIQDVKSCIVLERLGKNLRIHLQDLLQDGKPVGLHQAIEWSCQTAQGLAYIHSRKILHTDIGCHNLLLDQHNNLKLCDFAESSKIQLSAAMFVIYGILPCFPPQSSPALLLSHRLSK
jgi:serine/threonine protein kinase